MTPKPRGAIEKVHKLDFIKIKNFCASKDTIKKVKRHPTKWAKIYINHISDKALVSKIYKQLMQLNIKKTNTPIKNMQKT